MNKENYDQVGAIIGYEQGLLSEEDTVILFQSLIDTGIIYSLQGHYLRTLRTLVKLGLIHENKEQNLGGIKT